MTARTVREWRKTHWTAADDRDLAALELKMRELGPARPVSRSVRQGLANHVAEAFISAAPVLTRMKLRRLRGPALADMRSLESAVQELESAMALLRASR